ncbi:MAG: SUMF1/EgtB/PvdO family nonheme iron enzyme [Planctomycetes bacterium]|nr:SUMF1/EgtB/PvdO family nonheme iron enzyme [Planctomycetota bacterium]
MSKQALIISIALVLGACSRNDLNLADSELAILDSLCLTPATSGSADYLLWGKYEVSNLEYYADDSIADSNIPVVFVTFAQAQDWCTARGLRLPTKDEWMAVVGGAERASSKAGARNDLDLGVNRPLPGGVFERGRHEWGLYDVYSNVREWVDISSDTQAFAVGASFASRSDVFQKVTMNKQDSASDIGFRYVADAIEFIETQLSPRWAQLNSTQRQQAQLAIGNWKKDWRIALANNLDSSVVPRSLLKALNQ